MKKMLSKSRQDGFTLVEMVVVLAIMAILMTMLVPSLTGYVDRARNQALIAQTRSVVMAAQTVISEDYAAGRDVTEVSYAGDAAIWSEILTLAEADGNITAMTVDDGTHGSSAGTLLSLTYTAGTTTCTYTRGADEEYTVAAP